MRYFIFLESFLFQTSLVSSCSPVIHSDDQFYKAGFLKLDDSNKLRPWTKQN